MRNARRPHAELVKAVTDLLKLYGCFPFNVKQTPTPRKNKAGETVFCKGQLTRGVADVVACGKSGQFVCVECKIGKDALRPAQVAFRDAVEKRAGVHIVCRDTVDALLQARAEGKI